MHKKIINVKKGEKNNIQVQEFHETRSSTKKHNATHIKPRQERNEGTKKGWKKKKEESEWVREG